MHSVSTNYVDEKRKILEAESYLEITFFGYRVYKCSFADEPLKEAIPRLRRLSQQFELAILLAIIVIITGFTLQQYFSLNSSKEENIHLTMELVKIKSLVSDIKSEMSLVVESNKFIKSEMSLVVEAIKVIKSEMSLVVEEKTK